MLRRLFTTAGLTFTGRPPGRVRVRLTLLYGMLCVVSGAILLAITYLLVSSNGGTRVLIADVPSSGQVRLPGAGSGTELFRGDQSPAQLAELTRELRDQAVRQHQEELHRLLVESGVALAIMTGVSLILGWFVAGRVLRPLRTMTTTIQQISGRNLHQRLALEGPPNELKDLGDTVDGLLGRLETALDLSKRFVANAAHEMRTPLTLEHALLEEPLIDPDASLQSFRANFERLLRISEQRGQLLESLLTLSGSERGLDRRERIDLGALATQALSTVRAAARQRDLRLQEDISPAPMLGDAALIERLVINLLDNAVGYNVPGGIVSLTVGTERGRSVVTVANSGPVVPAGQVDRLFEPFQRLRRTAGDGHHGLGLSLVRAIAVAHDGEISARAHPEGGLRIEISFPPVGGSLPFDVLLRQKDTVAARPPGRRLPDPAEPPR